MAFSRRSYGLEFLLVLALTLILAACGDGDPEADDPARTDDAGAAELSAKLVGSGDLPPGWEEFDPESEPDQTEQDSGFCGEPVPDQENATGSASVQFARGEPSNRMVETLVTYESTEQATEAFDKVQQTVGTCKQWDLEQDGIVSRFNLSPSTFPNLADQTVAARVTSDFNVSAGSADNPAATLGFVTGDTVIVRYQNQILVLRHFSIGLGRQPEFSAADTEPAARRAVEKLMQAA
jgi:hypothetical protein